MALPRRIDDLEKIDEQFRSHYTEAPDGNGYVLELENDETAAELQKTKNKLDEFRNNNRELHSQVQEMKKKLDQFGDLSPDQIQKAVDTLQKVEDDEERKMLQEGKVEDVVSRRIEPVKADYDKKLQAKDNALQEREQELQNLRAELGQHTIDSALRKALDEKGIKARDGAFDDILNRAHRVFRIDDSGKPIAKQKNGDGEEEVIYGKDGNPMSPQEYATRLVDEAPHLFEQGGGGGAGSDQRPRSGKNRIPADDLAAFGANIDAIADGKVTVDPAAEG